MKLKRNWEKLLWGIVLVTLVFIPFNKVLAATVENLRTGNYADKTRLVLNADKVPKYSVKTEGKKLIISFDAKAEGRETIRTKDANIRNVYLQPEKDKSNLVINFAQSVPKYKIFSITGPTRIVVDVNKNAVISGGRQASNRYVKEIEPGFTYTFSREYLGRSPVKTHLLAITPNGEHTIKPILGQGNLIHKGRLTSAANKAGAKAAINASYFDSDVWVIGNLVIDKKWISDEITPRTAMIVSEDEKVNIIPSVSYKGKVIRPDGKSAPITGMNRMRLTNELIYYNDAYDSRTFTNQYGLEVRVEDNKVTEINKTGNSILRRNTIVLSGNGSSADFLRALKVGDQIKIEQSVQNDEADAAKHIASAGPLLVMDGKRKVQSSAESIASDIAYGRAPRTAVGVKEDGTILLVVVDGRSGSSVGMTLPELADFMIKIGAQRAMNFDGGGSSEMVIGGKVINSPSDGAERPVRVGIGVF